MNLEPNLKLRIILVLMTIIAIAVVFNPFIITGDAGSFSREAAQSAFAILGFFAIVYLWNEFNNLRISLNKKELEDENLLELEHESEKLERLKIEKASKN